MAINYPEPEIDDQIVQFPRAPYAPATLNLQNPVPDSPDYWVKRLLWKINARKEQLEIWEAYYDGRQPMSFASEKFREAFGSRFGNAKYGKAFSSNFMALVVDATAERLEVQGFRFKDEQGDDDLWEIWQANDMDAYSQIAHVEALKKGCAYSLVEPAPQGSDFPIITIEDPCNAIVERDPRTKERTAGLKRWIDDEGFMVVILYMPDFVYKYRTDKAVAKEWADRGSYYTSNENLQNVTLQPWQPLGEEWPLRNPAGVVPLVPLVNRPNVNGDGFSEIDPVMSNQDAINKYRADALVASEFAAFRQRWATGLEIPIDPDTGQAIEPFKAAVDRLWVVPPPDPDDPVAPPEVKFGEFEATDLGPYREMIEEEVGHVASISRTPYHYLIGQPTSVPPSGESLKSSEAGLVKKVKKASIFLGEGWEETMRVCLLFKDDPRADLKVAETIWADPETRNDASTADSVQKLFNEGIIDEEEAWVMLGLSPAQIKRLRKRMDAKKAEEEKARASQPAGFGPPVPAAGQVIPPPQNGSGPGEVTE